MPPIYRIRRASTKTLRKMSMERLEQRMRHLMGVEMDLYERHKKTPITQKVRRKYLDDRRTKAINERLRTASVTRKREQRLLKEGKIKESQWLKKRKP